MLHVTRRTNEIREDDSDASRFHGGVELIGAPANKPHVSSSLHLLQSFGVAAARRRPFEGGGLSF